MVDQTIEILIAAVFFTGMVCFWLALCHMVYLAYCRKSCWQNSLECHLDKTEAMFYVTKENQKTSESHEEAQTSINITLLYDQYDV